VEKLSLPPQDSHGASYAPISEERKMAGLIGRKLRNKFTNRMRGFMPWPGTYTSFRGQTCHLWAARKVLWPEGATPHQAKLIFHRRKFMWRAAIRHSCAWSLLQLEGRKRISAQEFGNGARLTADERLV